MAARLLAGLAALRRRPRQSLSGRAGGAQLATSAGRVPSVHAAAPTTDRAAGGYSAEPGRGAARGRPVHPQPRHPQLSGSGAHRRAGRCTPTRAASRHLAAQPRQQRQTGRSLRPGDPGVRALITAAGLQPEDEAPAPPQLVQAGVKVGPVPSGARACRTIGSDQFVAVHPGPRIRHHRRRIAQQRRAGQAGSDLPERVQACRPMNDAEITASS